MIRTAVSRERDRDHPGEPEFGRVVDEPFDGEPDAATDEILRRTGEG